VDFDVKGQLQNTFCVCQILGVGGARYNDAINKLFIDFMKSYDSIRRKFSCNTLIECGITMKEVQSIIMCLKETYCTVWEGTFVCQVSY